jgi:DNA polymerase
MKADDKATLWRLLSHMQDYADDGFIRDRQAPAFTDGEVFPSEPAPARASPPQAAASQAAPRQGAPKPAGPAPGGDYAKSAAIAGLGPEGSLEPLEGDSLEAIAAEVRACSACRLCEGRKNAVPGAGVPRPLVLVVGEGPGAEEDERGEPFVGAAGKLLDKMLAAIDLSRGTNAYIANVVKCRPPMNRDPAPDEQAACARFLTRQIALLRPRMILSLGRIASHALLSASEPITRMRGRVFDFRGIPLVASYHPSALLRDESLKRPAWEDLKGLRERLGADG